MECQTETIIRICEVPSGESSIENVGIESLNRILYVVMTNSVSVMVSHVSSAAPYRRFLSIESVGVKVIGRHACNFAQLPGQTVLEAERNKPIRWLLVSTSTQSVKTR